MKILENITPDGFILVWSEAFIRLTVEYTVEMAV
jgi:hypothetical protein